MMQDKRDECGCHRGCTTLPHQCTDPCRWPDCLTDEESQQLADECMSELAGEQADALRHSYYG